MSERRMPVRGQAVKWCECGDWFQSEKDEREHRPKCPGSPINKEVFDRVFIEPQRTKKHAQTA